MAYIHSFENNYYKPSENLRRLFEDLVIRPFETHPRTQPWIDHVINTNHTYHRKTILKRGRTNFSKPHNGFTPEDKVALYCVYYLPMHLFSSYHIFTKYLPPLNDKVVFVDFGCGPLTSGIAFWTASAGYCDITYLGIDSSRPMRDKAAAINRYGPNTDRDAFFDKGNGWLINDYNQLHQYLDDYIIRSDRTQIIFNFCYFLASQSLVINSLSNIVTQIVKQYNQHKMFVIYQNPPIPSGFDLQSSYLHENWYVLKTQLSAFHSQITGSNTDEFRYDSLVNGSRQKRDIYFDILSNESSAFPHKPFALPI